MIEIREYVYRSSSGLTLKTEWQYRYMLPNDIWSEWKVVERVLQPIGGEEK